MILFWFKESKLNLDLSGRLYSDKYYMESLFFGHLALEKLAKSFHLIFMHDMMITNKVSDKDATKILLDKIYNL